MTEYTSDGETPPYTPSTEEQAQMSELEMGELTCKIQSLINKSKEPPFTVPEAELSMYLWEYKRRGMDMEYFISGAGAPW